MHNLIVLLLNVKKVTPLWYPISELRSIICHVESRSVTCHLTQVNAPLLNPGQRRLNCY